MSLHARSNSESDPGQAGRVQVRAQGGSFILDANAGFAMDEIPDILEDANRIRRR